MHKSSRVILVVGLILFSMFVFVGVLTETRSVPQLRDISDVPVFVTDGADLAVLEADDSERAQKGLSLRYALPIDVEVTPNNSGVWEYVDGQAVWRLRINSPEAQSLSFGFTAYNMPQSGSLTMSSLDGALSHRPFTASDNDAHGQFWTPLLNGDELLLELRIDPDERDDLKLTLGRILHGYRPLGPNIARETDASGACNLDVVCGAADGFPQVEGFRDQIRAVAVIGDAEGLGCTGVLVNNSAEDFTPYFMTADHCGFTNTVSAAALVVYWDFENTTCRQPNSPGAGGPGDGSLVAFNSGAIVRATHPPADMTLLELDDPVPVAANAYYAGWDSTDAPTSGAVGIHHPDSDEKRISFENDPTTLLNWETNHPNPILTHIRVNDWDIGTTEPGSSGSPLFSPDGLVIGVLEGGGAACGNDEAEFYGRVAHTWTGGGDPSNRLCDWLDPGGDCTVGTSQTGIDAPIEGWLLLDNPDIDVVISETAGNSDGFYNLDESYSVQVNLTNRGTGPATQISATLSSENCNVNIINDSLSFPDVAPDDSEAGSGLFSFVIGNDCCGARPAFTLMVTYDSGVRTVTYRHDFSFFVGEVVATSEATTFSYAGEGADIPDGESDGVTLPLDIVSAEYAADVNLSVDITHPYVSDLQVIITDPDGVSVMAIDRPGIPATSYGCDEENITAVLDDAAGSTVEDVCNGDAPAISGVFRPNNPLSTFYGQPINGQWSVTVIDNATEDAGTFDAYELEILEGELQCAIGSGIALDEIGTRSVTRYWPVVVALVVLLSLLLVTFTLLNRRTREI